MAKARNVLRSLFAKLKTMPVDEVARRLGEPGFFVFDANARGRYVRGHIPGARHIHDPHEFTAADLPAEKDATLVFYCSRG